MRLRLSVLIVALLVGGCSRPTPSPAPLGPLPDGKPRVLVLVVIDQFRGDYLQRWADLYGTGGFQRLMKEGLWFTNCHYPYASTMTGCGHASFLTGCSPDRHGIIMNEWFDRKSGKEVYCASTEFRDLVYTTPPPPLDPNEKVRQGGTPERLLAESVGDVLKSSSNGQAKVVAVSLKDRSACLPGGKKADIAYYFDSRTGSFVTSNYYRDKAPNWVAKFNAKRPADRWFRQSWDRLRNDIDYTARSGPDDVMSESAGISKKMERVFPHPLSITKARPDKEYYDEVTCTPFANDLLMDFAKEAFDNHEIGRGSTTDLFTLSFSSNDIVGHSFGPDSHEVLDITLRSDRNIADLLDFLDSRVGRGNYLLAFSADHGICPIPEVSASKGIEAMRYDPAELRLLAEMYLDHRFGFQPSEKSPWIEADAFPWIYLNHRKIEARRLKPADVAEAFAEWVRKQSWGLRAYTRADLARIKPDDDAMSRRMLKAFHPDRAGDLGIVLKPFFLSLDYKTGTTHGSPHSYDTHVPLIFFGYGVPPQQSTEPVTPQAIAAVFSQTAGVRPPAQLDAPVPRAWSRETRN